MNSVEIANKSDYVEITDVWEASVRATHHFLKEEDIIFIKSQVLRVYLPNEQNLFCIRNDAREIIAFIGISGKNIDMLFIDPTERGKGLGKQLIFFAKEKFQIETVDVNEQNAQAVGFYEKIGFKIIGRDEKDGTGKPYPILHMKLKNQII